MREKILITVKTYPVLSRKYAELVCTAGVSESGEWRRLYPVRFRLLCDEKQFRKYQWVEAEIEKPSDDSRPESFRIIHDSLKIIGEPLPTNNFWSERKANFLDKVEIHTNLTQLIERAHRNELSLAAFKPTRMLDFAWKETEREWDAAKLAILDKERRQLDLFVGKEDLKKQFEVVDKVPYIFSYEFEDDRGKQSKLMIEDWEIGALYRNCLRDARGDENVAIEKVRAKYWDEFVESGDVDLTLILGTTHKFHQWKTKNPFVIVGVFYPRRNIQGDLFQG